MTFCLKELKTSKNSLLNKVTVILLVFCNFFSNENSVLATEKVKPWSFQKEFESLIKASKTADLKNIDLTFFENSINDRNICSSDQFKQSNEILTTLKIRLENLRLRSLVNLSDEQKRQISNLDLGSEVLMEIVPYMITSSIGYAVFNKSLVLLYEGTLAAVAGLGVSMSWPVFLAFVALSTGMIYCDVKLGEEIFDQVKGLFALIKGNRKMMKIAMELPNFDPKSEMCKIKNSSEEEQSDKVALLKNVVADIHNKIGRLENMYKKDADSLDERLKHYSSNKRTQNEVIDIYIKILRKQFIKEDSEKKQEKSETLLERNKGQEYLWNVGFGGVETKIIRASNLKSRDFSKFKEPENQVIKSLKDISQEEDAYTIYVNATILELYVNQLVQKLGTACAKRDGSNMSTSW